MRKKRGLLWLITGLVAGIAPARAQVVPNEYIRLALDNNLVLQDKKISLEKSMLALKQAKSLFLPTTWLDGQYLLSQGGRTIDIPVSTLVNPVYKTLNQLTSSNKFPMVDNVSEQLNPNNFYDLRIKTTMPLLNPDIRISRDIQEQQIQLKETEIDTYRRELVKEVKLAYFNMLKTGKAISIYENALEVVQQNLRVNQSLLKNGKGLPAYVSRAESEVKQVESQLQSAQNDHENTRAYFNFLLNRPLTDSVKINDAKLAENLLPMADSLSANVSGREELKSLAIAKSINENVLKMNNSFRKPRLNAFVDMGAQGYNFKVNNHSFFYLGGLQLQVPIYSGKRNLYKIEQTLLDAKSLETNTENTKQQLELAAFVSRNNTITAYTNYLASLKQEEAAKKYFKLIDKGFSEGVNSFIEFLDARNQLTNAKLQVNINQFKVLSAAAEFERQTASYTFN